jgi:hypothetical protein
LLEVVSVRERGRVLRVARDVVEWDREGCNFEYGPCAAACLLLPAMRLQSERLHLKVREVVEEEEDSRGHPEAARVRTRLRRLSRFTIRATTLSWELLLARITAAAAAAAAAAC